jgi:hypothetical protein
MRADAAIAAVRATAPATAGPGVRNPLDPARRIRAVLFDLDGTLYDQRRMRTLMAMELAAMLLRRPFQAPRNWRAGGVSQGAGIAAPRSTVSSRSDGTT